MKKYKYNKYYSIWSIISRHILTSLPYLNISKFFNILLSKIEELIGREKLKSNPFFIKIEPTNKCNLNCPGCWRADGLKNSRLGDMDFPLFTKIIEQLKKHLVKVSLYFEGESLLNSQVGQMVKYLTERNIGSVISSNLNYLPDKLAEELVASELTHLIVCLDGYEEESYQKYRQGGSFKEVIDNLKKIQQEKIKQKSKYPLIEIQAINFSYYTNEERERIKSLAKKLGADHFTFKDDLSEHYNNPSPVNKRCFWLYGNPSFRWDGAVEPCCYYYDKADNNFGSIKESDIKQIWNNENYRAARKYFKTGEKKNSLNLRCYYCDFFKYENNK